jgi:hypothetical protein
MAREPGSRLSRRRSLQTVKFGTREPIGSCANRNQFPEQFIQRLYFQAIALTQLTSHFYVLPNARQGDEFSILNPPKTLRSSQHTELFIKNYILMF